MLDSQDRENEGDLIIAADSITPAQMAFLVRFTRWETPSARYPHESQLQLHVSHIPQLLTYLSPNQWFNLRARIPRNRQSTQSTPDGA